MKILFYLSIVFLFSCNDIARKAITSFAIVNGIDTIHLIVTDSTIEGIKPDTGNVINLVAKYTYKGNNQFEASGLIVDLSLTKSIQLKFSDGIVHNYKLKIKSLNGLPIIYINSPAISSKEVYVSGTIRVKGNLDFPDASYTTQIKGRGNTTWGLPKNPYKIKLDNKASILNMPADKEWALLANWFDKSLIRNDIAFELASRLNMKWVPKRRFVDVFLYGQYNGNYLLTETVKVSTDRVNINTMSAKKPTDTTEGFLVEADFRRDGLQVVTTTYGIPFVLNDPDSLSVFQQQYIKNRMQSIEDHISTYKDISQETDYDEVIKWVLVNDLMQNADAGMNSSCYFYKDNNGKINAGPVWDFDLSLGIYSANVPEGWFVNAGPWFGGLWLYQPSYRNRFKQIWNQYRKQISTIPYYIDSMANVIHRSEVANFKKWDILNTPLFQEPLEFNSYEGEVGHVRDFYSKRFTWMDNEINKQ